MSKAINITGLAEIDVEEFLCVFRQETEKEIECLLSGLKSKEDRDIVSDISMKMIALYQQLYFTCDEKERASIQRTLNNYKSATKAISARYKLDVANTIISISKKASVIALGTAIKFVAL